MDELLTYLGNGSNYPFLNYRNKNRFRDLNYSIGASRHRHRTAKIVSSFIQIDRFPRITEKREESPVILLSRY